MIRVLIVKYHVGKIGSCVVHTFLLLDSGIPLRLDFRIYYEAIVDNPC